MYVTQLSLIVSSCMEGLVTENPTGMVIQDLMEGEAGGKECSSNFLLN